MAFSTCASLNTLLLVFSFSTTFSFECLTITKHTTYSQGTLVQFLCPKLESIVRKQLAKDFKQDIGQAAGLLRLHFHDCFVQGCDGSVLLDGSASGPSEQKAPPNLSLRAKSFEIINTNIDRQVVKQM